MRPSADAEQKEREYEDSIAHRYNRDYHEPPIMAEHSKAFASFAAAYVKPGDRVLDLGCGSASLWPLWKAVLPPVETLVGVDLSPKMLEIARASFPEGDFREGSFLEVPVGSGEFDVVIVSSAFHHISDALLPSSLKEVHRVLDEHGVLVGREPLESGRLGDRGGWVAGALMSLRHLVYRLTGTREYPEPSPGPDHHAYVIDEFVGAINQLLTVVEVEFRNPASLFVARVKDEGVASIAKRLDQLISHKEGQEVHYAARKNFVSAEQVVDAVHKAMCENKLTNQEMAEFLIEVAAAAQLLSSRFPSGERPYKR